MAENPTCTVEEFTRTTFDYVICGGGTAGLALAARLTENTAITVGVIEAGKYRIGDPLVDTPTAFPQMFENPEYDWCVYTVPQVGLFCIESIQLPLIRQLISRVYRKATAACLTMSRGESSSVDLAASII